jgi:hypothetical protein
MSQARAAEQKAFAVNGFIVRRSGFPATKDNADPFEGQSTQGGVMGFAAVALQVAVGASPIRFENGSSANS